MRRGTMYAGVAVATVMLLSACGASYDEDAHRQQVEALLGHEPEDWNALKELAFETCGFDEDRFALQSAVEMDESERVWLVTRFGVQEACPERLEEWNGAVGRS